MRPQRVGRIVVEKVTEFEFLFDPAQAFPEYDPQVAVACRDWLEPHFFDSASGQIRSSVHSYVVRTKRHTILVDTCVGNHKDRVQPLWHRQDRPYLANLAAIGLTPADIDVVMCTHLHGDHIGWNTKLEGGRWVPTFPNARYVFSRADYDYFAALSPGDRAYPPVADSIRPIVEAGQAAVVDPDYALDDEVAIYPAPGHTPGHYCVDLRSSGRRALLTGDLMHHPIQVRRPDWSSFFCYDRDWSRRTRIKFVDDMTDRDVLVLAAHFPGPTAGHIRGGPTGAWFALADA